MWSNIEGNLIVWYSQLNKLESNEVIVPRKQLVKLLEDFREALACRNTYEELFESARRWSLYWENKALGIEEDEDGNPIYDDLNFDDDDDDDEEDEEDEIELC